MSLEPAFSIIAKLGGAASVAGAAKVSVRQVYKWTWTKKGGGTGGLIPQRHHIALLNMARAKCVPLTAADFLPISAEEMAVA